MFKRNTLLVVLPFCLLACSKVKKLDDMAKATDSLQKQTAEMQKNTGNTDIMYKQLRAKETRATRIQELENLMKESTLIETKITSAGVYFKAMEYQLATEDEVLNEEREMNSLKEDAANDFIRVAGDIYGKIKLKNVDPTKNLEKNNDEAVFIALATSLHLNNSFQEAIANDHRIPTVSMYDIIKGALRKEKRERDAREKGNRNHGVRYTSYEQILISGVRKEICIELIKARVDMLSAIALKFMTDKRDMELSQFLTAISFKLSLGRLGGIDLPLTINDESSATKQTAIDALEGALKAKRFLNEIKVEKKLTKTLRSAYKHIKLQTEGDRQLENIGKQIEELLE